LEDFESTNHEEISLWKGGIVTVDDQSDEVFWHGDLNGKMGLFPKRVNTLCRGIPCLKAGDAQNGLCDRMYKCLNPKRKKIQPK
jgi:hypothetical protein